MKQFYTLISALIFTISAHAQTSAPDFSLTQVGGGPTYNLYTELNQNKVVVLKFFTTWCSICDGHAPHVESLWQNYGADGNTVWVWGVDRQDSETEQQIMNDAQQNGTTFPKFAMGESVANQYGVQYQPEYKIICPDKTYTHTTSWNQIDQMVQACNTSTSVNDLQNENGKLKLFPNPAKGEVFLNFQLENNRPVEISIFNQLGQQVRSFLPSIDEAGKQNLKLDLSGLESGLYMIALAQNGEQIANRKLLIQ